VNDHQPTALHVATSIAREHGPSHEATEVNGQKENHPNDAEDAHNNTHETPHETHEKTDMGNALCMYCTCRQQKKITDRMKRPGLPRDNGAYDRLHTRQKIRALRVMSCHSHPVGTLNKLHRYNATACSVGGVRGG
jgi:hypothetical protein